MNFSQYLEEVLSSPVPYKKVKESGGDTHYEFRLGDDTYQVHIHDTYNPNFGTSLFMIDFGILMSGGNRISLGNSNRREQFKVFSTVVDVVRKYFSNRRLKTGDKIFFEGGYGRGPIYKRFSAQFAKEYNGEVKINQENKWYRFRITIK